MKFINWRALLAASPLPMLALAASYGVYSFALLFVPAWVAFVQAASFELTYIGLAVLQGLDDRQRQRAGLISIGAVVTSIIYNTLAGWFHRQPELLAAATPIADLMLAILHGAPLAWVAFLVSDLLLHRQDHRTYQAETRQTAILVVEAPADSLPARNAPKTYHCKRCNAGPFDFGELGRHARKCPGDMQPVSAAD
jgi:hypothetical protein